MSMEKNYTQKKNLPPEFAKAVKRLPSLPKLASDVHLVSTEKGHWLHSSVRALPLKMPLYDKIALPLVHLIDGTRSIDEICDALPEHDPTIIKFLLVQLNKKKLLDSSGINPQ